MKISKTTIRMAAKRGITLRVEDAIEYEGTSYPESLEFYWGVGEDEAQEFDAIYYFKPEGLFYAGACGENIEDVPQWIENDIALRGHLDGFAAAMAAR